MTLLRTISIAALATTALTGNALGAGTLEDVGEIGAGWYWNRANGVSGNGQFVAGAGYDGTHHLAYVLTPDGVVSIADPGGWAVMANDVSNNGVMVGQMTAIITSAVRWTEAGGLVDLGRLEMLNGGSSFATGVSDDGTRVIGSSDRPSIDQYEAFIWVEGATTGVLGNSEMYSLGTLAGGGDSTGQGISGNGLWATGGAVNADGDGHAVRWSLADIEAAWTTIEDLGTLGGQWSGGQDISNDGTVVVGNSINADGMDRAFRWVEGATGGVAGNVEMYDLGTLGGAHSYASAVSADGSVVVGGAENASSDMRGYRWTAGTGMISIEDWLAANGVVVSSDIESANGVSDDGNVVVGEHMTADGLRAYVARVSDSGTGVMDVPEYTQTLLANARTAQMGVDLTWMPLNGAHHRPLMAQGRMEDDVCLWNVNDVAYKANTNTGIALTEVGGCGTLGDGVVAGLGVGASTSWQGLALGGNAQLAGAYVMGEVDWNPDGTPLLLSLTGVLGGWQANVNRAYTNGAGTDISSGSTGITAGVIRARVDWMDAAVIGNVSINPWISGAIGHTSMGGYTESGGAFPARFDAQAMTQGEVRVGVTAEAELSPQTTLSTTLEVAHRSGGAPGASGQVLGLFDFDMGGGNQGATWARAGLDLDHAISEDLSLSGSVHVATHGQDATVSGSLGLRATF
jgi:probable HAF family extracellular repeat protein